MATKNVTYSCDICGKVFGSLQKAKECELMHFTPNKISKVYYSKDDRKCQFPESIIIELSNKKGQTKEVEYKRC